MRNLRSITCVAVLVGVLAGCSSTPLSKADSATPASPMAVKPAETPSARPAPTTTAKAPAKALPSYLDPASALYSKRSIYFDYDVFSVKKDFESMLELHGKYLASNPSVSIQVEGNTDERGGAEYNLALGQKRADAVARVMKVFGVKPSQVEAVSWGKEKPKAVGHDEASLTENRRVDLVYPKQ